MKIFMENRQRIRIFTPIVGVLAFMAISKFIGDVGGLSQYGIQSRDIFVLLLIPAGFMVGNIYCGWFCPAGLVQRGLYKLGTLMLGEKRQKRWAIPNNIQSKLKYFRIVLLVAWLVALVLGAFGVVGSEIANFLKVTLIFALLFITIPVAFVTERFFCRNLCINGALYGLKNKFGKHRIERTESCINCGKCDTVCPMGIQVSKIDRVNVNQCITCLKCIDSCPKKDSKAIVFK